MIFKDRLAVFAITQRGCQIAGAISAETNAVVYLPEKLMKEGDYSNQNQINHLNIIPYCKTLSVLLPEVFSIYRGLIFIMALGIVNRVVAPNLKSKHTDPAVVTIDESARYVISTLSGHEGGANELAYVVSSITGASPVVTTATDASKVYICGVGCRKATASQDITNAVRNACKMAYISVNDLRCMSSVWLKKNEPGMIEAAKILNVPLRFIPEWMIKYAGNHYQESSFVRSKIGVGGVCEPAAVLSGKNTSLVLKKQVHGNVTVAIAKEELWHPTCSTDF